MYLKNDPDSSGSVKQKLKYVNYRCCINTQRTSFFLGIITLSSEDRCRGIHIFETNKKKLSRVTLIRAGNLGRLVSKE